MATSVTYDVKQLFQNLDLNNPTLNDSDRMTRAILALVATFQETNLLLGEVADNVNDLRSSVDDVDSAIKNSIEDLKDSLVYELDGIKTHLSDIDTGIKEGFEEHKDSLKDDLDDLTTGFANLDTRLYNLDNTIANKI